MYNVRQLLLTIQIGLLFKILIWNNYSAGQEKLSTMIFSVLLQYLDTPTYVTKSLCYKKLPYTRYYNFIKQHVALSNMSVK